MTIQEMRERKKELGYTNEAIAQMTGVPLGTVQKIFAGFTKAPHAKTMEALEQLFGREEPAERVPHRKVSYLEEPAPGGALVRDSAVYRQPDPKQGHYTLDDYYALPDERRVELIDGYIYDMASPTAVHQIILLQLGIQLQPCTDAHEGCEVFIAPSDVRINRDNKTMVQPDVFVVCHVDYKEKRRTEGAPEFIIEILSPSNRFHDMFRKLNLYRFAGVKEYWIVDPANLKVIVYDLEHDMPPVTHELDGEIPVGISDGECVIDFADIRRRIAKYL